MKAAPSAAAAAPRHALRLLVLGLAAPCGCRAAAVEAPVTPIQKAVELLRGMAAKAEMEKHQEQLQFASFSQFCGDVTLEKQKAIREAEQQLAALDAAVQKHDTEAVRLGDELVGHEAELVSLQNDSEVAAAVRDAERAEHAATHQNYSESLAALTEAIAVLKSRAHNTDGVYGMLQKVRPFLASKGGKAMEAFLARGSEEPDLTFVSPPVNAYEFRSSDIIKMLEQLRDRFRDEITELDKQEVGKKHAYTMLSQGLKASAAAAETARASKQASLTRHQHLSEQKAAERKDVAATRADDAAYLQDLTANCQQKDQEYHHRQQLREEELRALAQAVAVLSSDEVAGVAARHLTSVLPARATSLVQLRAAEASPRQVRVADFLAAESERLSSRVLSTIAVRARDGPFAKVKQLIEELLTRLRAQATEETEHKGWCDTELATNAHTRKTKTEEVDRLRVEIDGLDAAVAQLQKDTQRLSAEVAELDRAAGEAATLRTNEKTQNQQTIEEARQAQAAVEEATRLLQAFYSKAAKGGATSGTNSTWGAWVAPVSATSLAQQAPPPVWGDEPYKGLRAEGGGVLGMLEVIQSDFARLESDTTAAEAAAAEAHRKFMEDTSISKVQKQTDIKHKTNDRQDKEMRASDARRSLEQAQQMLHGAQEEYERLKPACLGAGQTYEERRLRRREEIEALQRALEILSGDLSG